LRHVSLKESKMQHKQFLELINNIFSGRSKLAKAAEYFDVSERTIRRWVNSEVPIPEWVGDKLIVENARQNPSESFKERGLSTAKTMMGEYMVDWLAMRDGDAVHIFHKGERVAIGVWDGEAIRNPLFQAIDAPMDALNESIRKAIDRHGR